MEAQALPLADAPDPSRPANMADMINSLIRERAGMLAFRSRTPEGWRDVTWAELATSVRDTAAGALAFGLAPGDAVCILAQTRPEWLEADLGALACGLVSAGIYPTEPAAKVAYVLNDCGARVVFVDSAEQVAKLKAVRAECPRVEAVVVIDDDAAPANDRWFIKLSEWRREGCALLDARPDAVDEAGRSAGRSTPAILIYTSGTTGPPKGAIVTHGNILYQLEHAPGGLGLQAGWNRPCFLPLCHVAERMFTYMAMASGMVSWFVDGPNQLMASIGAMRPHFILAVPRVYEKLYGQAQEWLNSLPAERREQLDAAVLRALEAVQRSAEGRLSSEEAAVWRCDQRTVLAELRAAMGLDHVAMLMSGGARFPVALGEWLHAIGARVDDIYGMTECGTIAFNQDFRTTPGLVGRPFPHGEVMLAPDGEILVRGPHVFAGYLNLPDKTSEAFRDGWFRTGDVGRFDDEGRLILLDRIKDIIISSSGKNITPSEVEGALKASPVVADAVAVGDGRKYVAALIMIDPAVVEQALAERGEHYETFAELAQAQSTRDLVADAVAEANRKLSRAEGVKTFRIIPRQFGPADEAMTPTLKLKRRVLIDSYADLVAQMYSPDGHA